MAAAVALAAGCSNGSPTAAVASPAPTPSMFPSAVRAVTPSPSPSTHPPAAAVAATPARPLPLAQRKWAAVKYSVDCSGDGIASTTRDFVDLDGDSKDEALVSILCNESTSGGNDTPASYLLLYDGASPAGPPRLIDTLGDEADEEVGEHFIEDGQLIVTTSGYSPDAPRCCPDIVISSVYEVRNKRFVLTSREEIEQ